MEKKEHAVSSSSRDTEDIKWEMEGKALRL